MADRVEAFERIEQAFVERALEVDGVAAALDHEPKSLPARPCVTLLWAAVDPQETSTGPAEDVTWEWEVRVYVDLESQNAYRQAQYRMKKLVPALLRVVRADRRLGDTCELARLEDGGDPPEFDEGRNLLVKTLRLVALVEEAQ